MDIVLQWDSLLIYIMSFIYFKYGQHVIKDQISNNDVVIILIIIHSTSCTYFGGWRKGL